MSRFTWDHYVAGRDPHPPLSSIMPDKPFRVTREEVIRDAAFDPASAKNGVLLHGWNTKNYEHPVNAVIVFEDGNFFDGTRFAISRETADKPPLQA
jgi:hypothetical protein